MGAVGSILSSLVTTIFQFWLARRENERKRSEEQSRRLRHIHLPTGEEVILINSGRRAGTVPESQRKAAETGSIALSVFVGGALVYQTNDPLLAFTFAGLPGFLLTRQAITMLKGPAG